MHIYKKIPLMMGFIILVISMPYQGTYAMGGRLNEFRFEDYKTGEEAQAVLLELHPIGSSVEALVERLRALNTRCGPITNPEFKNRAEYKNLIFCSYYESEIIFATEWRTLIRFRKDDPTKIETFEILSFLQAL